MSDVTNYSDEAKVIESRLEAFFDDSIAGIQYANENEVRYLGELNSPDEHSREMQKYIRVNIIPLSSELIAVGKGRTRNTGEIFINIFVREGAGQRAAREVYDHLYGIFHLKSFNGIECMETSPASESPISDDGWMQFNMSIEFYWDKCEN